MSLRLTRKGFITAVDGLPEMRGLAAYLAGRRSWRDDGGHGSGAGSGGDDDAGDDDDDSSDDDDADEDEEEDDDAKGKKKPKGKKDDEDDDEETVPKWKYDKLHNRMTAADRNATDLRKQLDDLKAKADLPAEVKRELEEIKSSVAEKDATIETLSGKNKSLTVKLAALTMTGDGMPVWEDVDTALRLADLSDVDVSDEGKVDKRALRSALKALAKEKPYLVKKRKTSDDTDGNEAGTEGSGPKMNGKRKGDKTAPDKAALAQRFPALNRIG